MNRDALNQWLAGSATVPGILGGGVRLPDGGCLAHSFNETWLSGHFEKTLQNAASAFTLFANYGLNPRWVTWNFAQAQLRFASRADGLLLLFVAEPNAAAAQNLDPLTEEFLARDFKN